MGPGLFVSRIHFHANQLRAAIPILLARPRSLWLGTLQTPASGPAGGLRGRDQGGMCFGKV